jgi:hypothetical protein
VIFLFKDHTYKVYSVMMDDHKLAKKFHKDRKKIEAVLVECATDCHSDVYTVVKAEHFKTNFRPFSIKYTIGLYDVESPLDEQQSITRTLHIDTILDYYNATALIYQMLYTDNVGDMLSIGDRRVTIGSLSIETGRDSIKWDSDGENLIDFLARNEMVCDTDKFLDASIPKDLAIEEGAYVTRYDKSTGKHQMMYYYHDKKYFLCMYNGKWELSLDRPTLRVVAEGAISVYGICMNSTGLLYLANDQIAVSLYNCDSISLIVELGEWYNENHIWLCDKEKVALTYEGWNMEDILYMGLYLPQIWDIDRYLNDISPVFLSAEFVHNKHYTKRGEYHIPHRAADLGLELDLLAIFSMILTSQSEDISFDD